MTQVRLALSAPTSDGTGRRPTGSLEFRPTKRRNVTGDVVLPAPFTVGVGATTPPVVTVAPTEAGWAWQVVERVQGGVSHRRYVLVPDSVSVIDYAALVEVDPATLDPVTLSNAWWTQVTDYVTTGLAGKQNTATLGADVAADATVKTAFGLSVAVTVSASATLAAGKFTPVDATAAARTMTLPTGAGDGVAIGVEKVDSSANTVSVTGNIRGVPATTITLPWAHETLLLRADSAGSWWPVAGHKTKTSLDTSYVGIPAGGTDGQALVKSGSSVLWGTVTGATTYVSVKSYGATGDGSTDDRTAIQAAIDAVQTAGGGVVYFPPGRYKLTTDLIPRNKVSVLGAGSGATVLLPFGQAAAFKLLGTSGAPLTDCTFANFEIDGSNQTQTGYNPALTKGIFIQYLLRCSFRDLYIHDTGATGLGVDFLVNCSISRILAISCGRLYSGDFSGNIGASGIGLGSGGYAVEPVTISDCILVNNKNCGILIETQTTTYSQGYRIANCYASGNYVGIHDKQTTGTVITGCQALSSVTTGIVVGLQSTHGRIENCVIASNGADGVQVFATNNPGESIADCEIYSNTGYGISYILTGGQPGSLTDCVIHDNAKSGVNWTTDRNIARIGAHANRLYNNGTARTTGDRAAFRIATTAASGISYYDVELAENRCHDTATGTQSVGIHVTPTCQVNTLVSRGNDMRRIGNAYKNEGTVNSYLLSGGIALAAATVAHTFDGADAGTVPPTTTGNVSPVILGSGTWGISSNQLAPLSGGNNLLTFDSGRTDGTVEVTLAAKPADANLAGGLAFRCGGGAVNGLYLSCRESSTQLTYSLYKITAGTTARLSAAAIGPVPVAGDRLRVQYIGARVAWYINEELIEVLTVTDFPTYTGIGFYGNFSAGGNLRWDNLAYAPIL